MLEKIPSSLGRALAPLRAGAWNIVAELADLATAPRSIVLTSAEIEPMRPLPVSCTADGPGISPPLSWSGLPAGARSLALVVEDADSPTPSPLVHSLAYDIPVARGHLLAGELSDREAARRAGIRLGKSSALGAWLPPDPPNGHGVHTYYFQLFALDRPLPLGEGAGRSILVQTMRRHVLAVGLLAGTYARALGPADRAPGR